jgi:hypothetical protein
MSVRIFIDGCSGAPFSFFFDKRTIDWEAAEVGRTIAES